MSIVEISKPKSKKTLKKELKVYCYQLSPLVFPMLVEPSTTIVAWKIYLKQNSLTIDQIYWQVLVPNEWIAWLFLD